MAGAIEGLARGWNSRAAFRPRGSAVERFQGKALLGFALLFVVALLVLPSKRAVIVFGGTGVALFVVQGTALLFTVPRWWDRCANWLHNRAPKWAYLLLIVSFGCALVLSLLAEERTDAGFLAISLAVAARTASSLMEPQSYALDDHPYAGRIRRALIVHSGFMLLFAFGAALALRAALTTVPISVYLTLGFSAAAFFFNVQLRVRRICKEVCKHTQGVLNGLAYLNGDATAQTFTDAITALDWALETPVETFSQVWGKPIVPFEIRVQLVAWLKQRVLEGTPVRDSADPEYRALLEVVAACRRWNGS
ncbi:hypothetical protein ABUW04_32995 [Streptacidiphilus sp. N1-10]|uniref:Uncharacterized protein n=1 Tax=Streptacidiphilus jeojiensis TaxID=3229225 RepID=A0ABV6XYA2_9ACTN